MSRTYRNKDGVWWHGYYDVKHVLKKHVYVYRDLGDGWQWTTVKIDPNSEEGKCIIAKFYASHEGGTRGPMWFHRLFAQRPYRRRAKREIQKFFEDEEYEVMIESKPHREYWD